PLYRASLSVAATLRTCHRPVAATPEPHPLSLHDALPISREENSVATLSEAFSAPQHHQRPGRRLLAFGRLGGVRVAGALDAHPRSEEHTSELQSRENLVCRLLLEKKKKTKYLTQTHILLH